MFTKLIGVLCLLCASAAQAAQTVEVTSFDDVWPETVLGLYEHDGTYNGRDFYTNGDYDLGWDSQLVLWQLAPAGEVGQAQELHWEQDDIGLQQRGINWGPYYPSAGSGVTGVLDVFVVPEPETGAVLGIAALCFALFLCLDKGRHA